MSEKEEIYSSKFKSRGIFKFSDFYKFCYDWLTEEDGLFVVEEKYVEKLSGDTKELEIEWVGTKKVTDYFKFEAKVKFKVLGLKEIEIEQNGKKIKTNSGQVELSAKGILIRDYQGKFEASAWTKFLRGIYDKWVVPANVEKYEGKLISDLDEFLEQGKAWLDLEGRK